MCSTNELQKQTLPDTPEGGGAQFYFFSSFIFNFLFFYFVFNPLCLFASLFITGLYC